MMDNETILKLFKKFAGDPLNVKGLLVTPIKVEASFKTFRGADLTNIYFRVTNPNDVPYFSPIVEDYIYNETEDFESFVNEKIEVYFVPSFKTGMYINEELGSKIQKVFNSVKVIEFTTGTPFIGYKRYKLFIESVGLSIGGWDSETYYILNNVKIKSAYKNGEPCDITEAKDEYTEVFLPDQDSYWETEHLYMEIDNILNDYPLFSDPYRNVVSYYDTKFIG
jgi:hypothetical protein